MRLADSGGVRADEGAKGNVRSRSLRRERDEAAAPEEAHSSVHLSIHKDDVGGGPKSGESFVERLSSSPLPTAGKLLSCVEEIYAHVEPYSELSLAGSGRVYRAEVRDRSSQKKERLEFY